MQLKWLRPSRSVQQGPGNELGSTGKIMADILSQDEVDMLLSAVSEGEIDAAAGDEAEVDAGPGRITATYDFRRPERVSKEQLRGLQGLFESFARELSVALPGYLRTSTRVELICIDQLTYDEFVLSVSRPTSLNIVDMNPLPGNCIVEIALGLAFPVIDRLLGGKGTVIEETRPLTEIEQKILSRMLKLILDSMTRAWTNIVKFNMKMLAHESDPLIVQIVSGSEMVILVAFEAHIGETTGTINLCIPLLALNPLLEKISAQSKYTVAAPTERISSYVVERVHNAVSKAVVPLAIDLGMAMLPVRELVNLQIGDIIELNTSVSGHVDVLVGDVPKFMAHPGKVGERTAVQISGYKR